jgi:predicted transcriptional regulator
MKSHSVTPRPDAELAKWCDMLTEGAAVAEKVPEGWYTVKELAKARNRSECATSEMIRRLLEQGRVEQREFTIKLIKRTRPVPHYRIIQ